MRFPVGDERLVARIRAGDERAFELAYDRYHAQLLAFCRHMLGSREEAEDALQHVFVSAHRQLLRDDRPIRLKPWLYAIARNRCLSALRARREELELEHEPSTDGLAVAGEVERRQELRDMLEDIARLPDDQRAALVLAELGDLSHPDIAVALDVRAEKVKALIFQAREALAGWRQARDADCAGVREQLATLRGSALRRAPLRRHVAVCPGCAAFEREVGRQRQALALVLPIVPSLALKKSVLAAALSTGEGVAGAAAVGSGAAAGGGGIAVKAVLAVAVVAGAGGGGAVVLHQIDRQAPAARDSAVVVGPAEVTPAVTAAPGLPAAAAPAFASAPASSRHAAPGATPRARSRSQGRAKPHHRGASHGKSGTHHRSGAGQGGTHRRTGAGQGAASRPATPPGQAKRPATTNGTVNGKRPATPPGTANRPAVAPGQSATSQGTVQRTVVPGATRRVKPAPVPTPAATAPVVGNGKASPPANPAASGALKHP